VLLIQRCGPRRGSSLPFDVEPGGTWATEGIRLSLHRGVGWEERGCTGLQQQVWSNSSVDRGSFGNGGYGALGHENEHVPRLVELGYSQWRLEKGRGAWPLECSLRAGHHKHPAALQAPGRCGGRRQPVLHVDRSFLSFRGAIWTARLAFLTRLLPGSF